MNDLVKLDVLNVTQARVRLEFRNIKFTIKDEEVFVSKEDASWVIAEFAPWLKKPPKPGGKKRDPSTYKGARPTLESQGKRSYVHYSISISPEANDHLTACQQRNELKSWLVDRIILEHKAITDLVEEAE